MTVVVVHGRTPGDAVVFDYDAAEIFRGRK